MSPAHSNTAAHSSLPHRTTWTVQGGLATRWVRVHTGGMGPSFGAPRPFTDRHYAGQELATQFASFQGREDVVVLGLARGGVPIAAEVARSIGAPFDALIVRKLGVPGQGELAFGALAAHGPHRAEVRLENVLSSIPPQERTRAALDEVRDWEHVELIRRQGSYLRGRGIDLSGRTVVLCDDGLATGASMRAAIEVVRQSHPERVIVAAPVGPAEVCSELASVADEVICPRQPADFGAVGAFYAGYEQLTDEDVLRLLGG